MSWFGSTKYPQFEEKIAEATSESIPNGEIDFATALEVSDMIRSKQVPPKESMRALKRRFMDADNVNMQKSAFKLIDFCIKNGGSHFINEIASKEFMDPLVAFLKNKDISDTLKTYLLGNIQTWSIMVSTNPKYDYINECYKKLQNDGFEFPAINDVIDSNMIESKVAPEWQDSDACMMCSKMFTFLNRKHHCRSCGGVFCALHSSKTIELPELGINIPVRVCDSCYSEHKAKIKKSKKHGKNKSIDSTTKTGGSLADEDDEIKRAIELSLKDTATKNSYTQHVTSNATVTHEYGNDEDDEEMKAAIAASLQELNGKSEPATPAKEEPKDEPTGLYANLMVDKAYTPVTTQNTTQITSQYTQAPQYNQPTQAPQYSQPTQQYPQQYPPQYQQPQQVQQLPQQTYQQPDPALFNVIRASDEKKVVDFIQSLDNQTKTPGQHLNPKLIQLHSDMVLLLPKFASAINKEHTEIEKFQSLYSKLFVIGRLYDDILQNRLKQEQETIKAQHINLNINPNYSSPSPHGYPPQTQLQYMSPQSTFGQAPPVVHQLQAFQQQQTGAYAQPMAVPSTFTPTYANPTGIPSAYAVPESIIPQHTYQPSQPPRLQLSSSHGMSPSSPYDATTVEDKLASLPSVQYASLPTETAPTIVEEEEPEPEIVASPVVVPEKEPEIINLIDL